jgi:nucleoside-diphosphate-sugar epimerase
MNKDSRIYVAGHKGLVGSAIVRALQAKGHTNLLVASRAEVDLREQEQVRKFFRETKPEYVFLAAAKVGGILANDTYPVEFLYDNLMLEANVIHAAAQQKVKKLLFLGHVVHLPEARGATDQRRVPADGAAGADQRVVRDREDRGHQAVPGVPEAVRPRLHLRDADESVRTWRQL